jgi:hypothetical protein
MPEGCSLAESRSCLPVDCWLGRPEGSVPVETMNVCGSLAWQALEVQSGRDHAGVSGGSLGECSPSGVEEEDQGSEILWPAEQWLHGPM